ncbi:MAG: PHP domain-containing protein [Ignavibacteria bacterium]|nr:PHP domain-containing protein [Ignavibacteria bacterium]
MSHMTYNAHEYIGAIHIHSHYSDGTGSVEEIARAASELGLDYIILTDHNTLRAKDEGAEKFYDGTLLIVGYEINDKKNQNHYLALRVDKTLPTRLNASEYVQKIAEAGGFGFIAHPHEKRDSMKEHPPYPWTAWDCPNITGIEIWNHMSEWMENLTEQNKYEAFLHPLRTIESPAAETLQKWDELSLSHRVVGIGGVDAHAHKVNVMGIFEVEVFPYKVLFKSIRTHILTDLKFVITDKPEDIFQARSILLNSLESGNCFVANDYLYNSYGFRFYARVDTKFYSMGCSLPLQNGIRFFVEVPAGSITIKLIRNGKITAVSEQRSYVFECTEAGVYRIEVYYMNKPWIFSNHIHIEE